MGGVSWQDKFGNEYMFGGSGIGDKFNDLWEWNAMIKTWISIPQKGTWPSGRYNATSWTDQSGNAYVFGGWNSNDGYLDDLWEWNNNTGTWVQIPKTLVWPKAGFAVSSWVDNSDNAYLFGGSNKDTVFNEMWSWSNKDKTWKQIQQIGNIPSARQGAEAWVDRLGNAYVLGGDGGPCCAFNDMWEFTLNNISQ